MDTPSQKFLLKRKLMLALPVLVLPFMTLLFWASGGGKATGSERPVSKGLDMTLPSPNLKTSQEDKLSLYELAEQKAQKLKDDQASDPYRYDTTKEDELLSPDHKTEALQDEGASLSALTFPKENDITERDLRRQLAALEKELNAQSNPPTDAELPAFGQDQSSPFDQERMAIGDIPLPYATADPELQQLDNMLSKILDIEHPERVKNKLMEESQNNRGLVYPVEATSDIPQADRLQPEAPRDSSRNSTYFKAHITGNSFYEAGYSFSTEGERALTAVVHETQTLVSGATIKLRLTTAILISGREVPIGTFLYGVCSLEGERLTVSVKHIRYQNTLLPVNLSVYDMDGLEGIRLPGAISRDAAKQGMATRIQSLDFYGMNPSLGAQAASAGIQTAKTLLGNKAKLVKATVPAGYLVLLIDNNQRN